MSYLTTLATLGTILNMFFLVARGISQYKMLGFLGPRSDFWVKQCVFNTKSVNNNYKKKFNQLFFLFFWLYIIVANIQDFKL